MILSRVPIREPSERLEPYEGKLSCTVLRGGAGSNAIPLPDQLIENKQKFISQVMTSKSPARSCEDIDESVLSYAEVKALATGDPRIKEKMDLEIQVTKLKMLKSGFESQHYALEDKLSKYYPEATKAKEILIQHLTDDEEFLKAHPAPDTDNFSITIRGMNYSDKKEAGMALMKECGKLSFKNDKAVVGEYCGFQIQLLFDPLMRNYHAVLKRQASHPVEFGSDSAGNITRLNNALKTISQHLETVKGDLETMRRQITESEQEIKKTFPQKRELMEKSARLDELSIELSCDHPKTQLETDRAEDSFATPLSSRLESSRQSIAVIGQSDLDRSPDIS